jgi:hypothetical protein
MIKMYVVSSTKMYKYLIEVINTDTNKLRYYIAIGNKIKVNYNLKPISKNIIQYFDNFNDALIAYEK